jgi:hypothetical protein
MQTVVSTLTPRRRAKLPTTTDDLPRCSTRVTVQAKIRVSNPEVQAQNMLMRKWHITSESRWANTDTILAYNELYNSPLRSSQ